MRVFRITLTLYAQKLAASGRPARWNVKDSFVVYTAGSAALACLENLAHRSGADITKAAFSLVEVDIPDTVAVQEITRAALDAIHPQWHYVRHYAITQRLGERWLTEADTAVLKIPSAIIATECNYLINPRHRDFDRIKIHQINPFIFDERLG